MVAWGPNEVADLIMTVLSMMISRWKPIAADGDPDVVATLRQAFPESGVYMYPWIDAAGEDELGAEEEFTQQHAEGPIVQVFYHAGGIPASEMGKTMGFGFAHLLASAVIGCILLAMSGPSCCYGTRVGFIFGLGIFATLWIEGANLIWWHYPSNHVVFIGAYSVAAWLLAGLVIGAIVKKPKDAGGNG